MLTTWPQLEIEADLLQDASGNDTGPYACLIASQPLATLLDLSLIRATGPTCQIVTPLLTDPLFKFYPSADTNSPYTSSTSPITEGIS